MGYRDRSRILTAIGVLLLLAGFAAAFLGPIEIYCFYLFVEGGRFHYEGFGFGSFMFGNIACQVAGYYLIAMLCIPLGYGHLKARRWARSLSLALFWCWLVVGLPLIVIFFFMLVSAKELTLATVLVVTCCLGLSYLAIPWLFIRFYRSPDVVRTFEARDPKSYWTEELPTPVLVLCSLYLFYALCLHVPILFNGLFPLFGVFVIGLEGISLLDLAILGLVLLAWGTFKRQAWAWWGAVAYFALIAVSSIWTLVPASYADMLSAMDLPPAEIEILGGVPLQGFHFAAFFGLPWLITLVVIVLSRRHVGVGRQVPGRPVEGGEGSATNLV